MKKVAIIGTAPASRDIAPYDDPSWDIWVCSPGNMNVVKRATVWFELHGIDAMVGEENRGWSLGYFEWLKKQPFPVYMQEPNQYVPNAIPFPVKTLLDHFKTRNWFTSSPAYMLAFAIWQKVDEIGIWGIDMANPEEHYTLQRPGLTYWIEKAKECGIRVTVPMESCLGQPTPMYGYGEASRMGRRIQVIQRMCNSNRQQLFEQRERIQMQISFHDGALEQIKYFDRTFVDGEADCEVDFDMAKKAEESARRNMAAWPAPPAGEDKFALADSGLLVPKAINGSGRGDWSVSAEAVERPHAAEQPEA